MIQRIQSVFLLLAVILGILTLSVPVGMFEPQTLCIDDEIYCLMICKGDGSTSWMSLPLFVLQAISVILALVGIFMYKNRMLQAKLCLVAMTCLIFWMMALAILFYFFTPEGYQNRLTFWCALPIVQYLLLRMARQRILADEKLVRSVDRIR